MPSRTGTRRAGKRADKKNNAPEKKRTVEWWIALSLPLPPLFGFFIGPLSRTLWKIRACRAKSQKREGYFTSLPVTSFIVAQVSFLCLDGQTTERVDLKTRSLLPRFFAVTTWHTCPRVFAPQGRMLSWQRNLLWQQKWSYTLRSHDSHWVLSQI